MGTAPTLFRFEGKPLNVELLDNGDTIFDAAEVCRILELAHVGSALRVLDEDEKGVQIKHTLGGEQNSSFVTEPGLYKLISRSRKEAAKRFDRWVRHEVLPTIRKTGSYVAPMTREQQVASALILSQQIIAEKDATISVMSPKAAVYDACMNLDGVYGLQQSGRILRQKPNLFVRHLKTQWLFHQGGQLIPRSDYSMAGQGLFDVKWTVQHEKNIAQTYVTPKGLAYFAKKLGVEIDLSQMGGFPMGSSDGFEQRPN